MFIFSIITRGNGILLKKTKRMGYKMVLDYFKLFWKQKGIYYKEVFTSYIIEDRYLSTVVLAKSPGTNLDDAEIQKLAFSYVEDLKTFLEEQDLHTILIFDSIFIDEDYILGIGNGAHIIELLQAAPQEHFRGFWVLRHPFLSHSIVLQPDFINKSITFYYGYDHNESSEISVCKTTKDMQTFFENWVSTITEYINILEETKESFITNHNDVLIEENGKYYLLNKPIRFSKELSFQDGIWMGVFKEIGPVYLEGVTTEHKKEFFHQMDELLSLYRLQKKIYSIFFEFDSYSFITRDPYLHFQSKQFLISWQLSKQNVSLFIYENGKSIVFSSSGNLEEMEQDLQKKVSNFAREKSLSSLFEEQKQSHTEKLSSYLGRKSNVFLSNVLLTKNETFQEQLEKELELFFKNKFQNCPAIYETTLEKVEMGDFLFYLDGDMFQCAYKKN